MIEKVIEIDVKNKNKKTNDQNVANTQRDPTSPATGKKDTLTITHYQDGHTEEYRIDHYKNRGTDTFHKQSNQ